MESEEEMNLRSLLPTFRASLASLSESPSFKLLRSLPPRSSPRGKGKRTVCILDSSFNPPTKAHLHLALQSLSHYSKNDPSNLSLLLLLATTNADKKPSPASYEQRLAMMTLLAREVNQDSKGEGVQVDIGITPYARFIDKSTDLATHSQFEGARQVWVLGFDTLIRLLDTKYYPPHHTLDGVYSSLLKGDNRIAVFTRPTKSHGDGITQRTYFENLDKRVVEKLDVIEAEEMGDVSSTFVRNGVKSGEEGWRSLVGGEVGEWIAEEGLYKD